MLIDFHSHILPKADHGCDSVEMALEQLKLAAEAGVDVVVATPHYTPYLESVADFITRREEAVTALRQTDLTHFPQVLVGAEVLLCKGVDRLPEIQALCIEGTSCILVEMPMGVWDEELVKALVNLNANKTLQVIVAHVDRYPLSEIDKILGCDLLMQLNASAICSYQKRRQITKLMNNPNTVALGSDIHGIKIGYKQYTKAVKILKDKIHLIMGRSKELLNIDSFEV